MRTKAKRLVLHRETLVQLDQRELEHVGGRATTTSCEWTNGHSTCHTWQPGTCSTNLC